MDELDLAKRAIRRNLMTEEQLREAQAYAQGGRPLLSVLLDLGYLRPADLPLLFAPLNAPAPARPRSSYLLVAIGAVFVIAMGALILSTGSSRLEPPVRVAPPPVVVREAPPTPPLSDRLAALAGDHLADAERQQRELGTITPQVRDRLARAAALYEEAIRERPREVYYRIQLGRCRELLDQWEIALQIFGQVVEAHPENGPALVGAARCQLLLQRHEGARANADRACAVAPHAEAFLVRGRALLSLGYREAARRDFEEAQRRDSTLLSTVEELLGRLR